MCQEALLSASDLIRCEIEINTAQGFFFPPLTPPLSLTTGEQQSEEALRCMCKMPFSFCANKDVKGFSGEPEKNYRGGLVAKEVETHLYFLDLKLLFCCCF